MERYFDRWPSFSSVELLSPDGISLLRRGVFPLRIEAVDRLQMLRDKINSPLMVNTPLLRHRGFRSPEENRIIYQRSRIKTDRDPIYHPRDNRFSFHIAGIAFDVSADLPQKDLIEAAIAVGFKGIGIAKNFVHVDLRDSEEVVKWTY